MHKRLEKKARKRGGVLRYRVIKRGGKTFRCMITKRKGHRGGKTLCYRIKPKRRKKRRR